MPWFDRQQRTYLAELAQQYGFYFIDLTPALQAAAQANRGDELLYYRYDLHLTPTGHQVVGRAVYAGLRQLELLEGEE
jgi:lysophospholipase L1-like esterase